MTEQMTIGETPAETPVERELRHALGLTPITAAKAAEKAIRDAVGRDDESTGSRLAEAATKAILAEADRIGYESAKAIGPDPAVRRRIESAYGAGAELYVRWWNRPYRGWVTRLDDEGFMLDNRDENYPERRWCGWHGTVDAQRVESREKLAGDEAWKDRWPEQDRLSDLFEKRLGPFARNSETSRRAAVASYGKQGSQRYRVMRAIVTAPMTRDELAEYLHLSPNTIRPRVRELVEGGWIREHEDLTRETEAGHDAAVLVVTAVGRADWEMRESR